MYCPTCGIKVTEKTAFCSSCGHSNGDAQKLSSKSPRKGIVAISYGFALCIPFIGFILGLYLLFKEKIKHGFAVILISIAMFIFWLQFFG
jgi:uncharacterized membrane protein YvbJ